MTAIVELSTSWKFENAAPATAAQASVLIVDDNPAKRLALTAALQPLGHRVVEADSGVAALRCVLAEDFAVILMDVQMPDMDGFETATLIRQRRQSEITPIIFITAYSRDEIDAADHYAGGAVDFIFAPIPPAELRSKVSFFAHVFLHAQRLATQSAAVQSSVDQLRVLTETSPIGIFQTDHRNRYVYTNPRWTEITGVSAEDAIGRDWDTIVQPEQRRALETVLSEKAGLSHRFLLAGRQEHLPRTAMITSRPIPDRDGGPLGWVGTLADVTVETEAETAILVSRDAAVAASNMQRNFAASASHELRTPTASIIGYVEEVLQNDALSAEDHELLDVVYRNAQRLSNLVDDLMILDQSAAGTPLMHVEPTALTPLVSRVLATFGATAQRAGIRLTSVEETAVTATADPARVEQALNNLIGNALKFTPDGGEVTVVVGAQEGLARVQVIDTGTGIELDDQDKIFDRFYRTRSAVDDAVKGSGLGLAIARGMIEAQGGSITVTSAVDAGSTFTVLLPLVPSPPLVGG